MNLHKDLEITMRCDEQGTYPVEYVSHAHPFLQKGRDGGIRCTTLPFLWRWVRVYNDKQVRFVADDDNHVFIWCGPVPKVQHPFIAKLLKDEEHVHVTDVTGGESVSMLIKEFTAEGDKVVNISGNKTWGGPRSPFEYRWGPLPGKRLDYKAYEDTLMDDLKAQRIPAHFVTTWGDR